MIRGRADCQWDELPLQLSYFAYMFSASVAFKSTSFFLKMRGAIVCKGRKKIGKKSLCL